MSNITKASTLMTSLDQAIGDVSSVRAKLGAAQNQIEAAINSLGVAAENLSASESRIRDADIASVTTELVSKQIMQQAGVSVLGQAASVFFFFHAGRPGHQSPIAHHGPSEHGPTHQPDPPVKVAAHRGLVGYV